MTRSPLENQQTAWAWFVATRYRCFLLGMVFEWVFLTVGYLVMTK